MRRLAAITVLAGALAGPASGTEFAAFFNFDSAELRPEHLRMVAEAAAFAGPAEVTAVRVVGRANTSGPPAYNLALSRRRAEAVAAELVRRGVDRSKIVVDAKGEEELSVVTGDGVREPLNRIAYIQHVLGER